VYVKYGDYSHQIGQDSITYTVQKLYSQWRGFEYATRQTMTAQGALGFHPTKTLSEEIDDFIAAYSVNGKTFGLYTDAGVATQHIIDSTNTLLKDGPKVVVRKWPRGDRGEYACHREYLVEVSAVFTTNDDDDPWPGIIRYQETMQYRGTGGLVRKFLYDQDGGEWEQAIYALSPLVLVQSGVSIGWGGYALPLDPVEPARQLYHLQRNRIGPIMLGSTWEGTEYHYSWSYVMSLPPNQGFIHTAVSR